MYETVSIELNRNGMGFYQRREILLEGRCPSFLPLSIASGRDCKRALVRTGGYIKLSLLNNACTSTCIDLLILVLYRIEIAKDYMIYPEEYLINPDTIYVSEDLSDVRFAFAPADESEGFGEYKALLTAIVSFMEIGNDDAKQYLKELYNRVRIRKLSNGKMIAIMQELKREAVITGKN